jgi:hypothetical protein
MATVLQPIVNGLNTVLVQLRTELRGLQTDADGAGIAIVMGPAVDAGKFNIGSRLMLCSGV